MGRQRGIALITVLLVMVIAVAAVTHALMRNHLAVSRTGAILANTQLAEFVNAAEAYAIVLLEEDFEQDQQVTSASDALSEDWAQRQEQAFQLDNGQIRIQIKDLQACLNVNNLANEGPDGPWVKAFQKLVRGVDGGGELVLAIQDWLDKDDKPQTLGSEDDGYLGLELAFRTPDILISDVSELRSVKGMDTELWEDFKPYICALPEDGTKLNANTAPVELLDKLYDNVNITNLNARRAEGPLDQGELGEFGIEDKDELLFYRSQYFVAYIAVQLNAEHQQYWESILRRDDTGRVRVLQRQRHEFSGQFLQDILGN
ncbi:MAG: type II secretion system minor pseudopilin GspK [Gammaproteobacteria bacterium]|nr:type II secretion system minor pseudopilin GspK [Gammaproteobacteria bacterium]